MLSIRSNSANLLIVLTCCSGCLLFGMSAQAEEVTALHESRAAESTSESNLNEAKKLAAANTSETKSPAVTKDATEEALIRKTEPLPQFYFPY